MRPAPAAGAGLSRVGARGGSNCSSTRCVVASFQRASCACVHGSRRTLQLVGRARRAIGCASAGALRTSRGYRAARRGAVARLCRAVTLDASSTNVLVGGGSGYIGQAVVRELLARQYNLIAVTRKAEQLEPGWWSKSLAAGAGASGATAAAAAAAADLLSDGGGVVDARLADVTSLDSLRGALRDTRVDVCVSCLASRTGGVQDSEDIDYVATRNLLGAAAERGCQHFILLSAICVQKPLLEFQRAKLKFEAELVERAASDDITFSIVRPTAYFKSLAAQVPLVQKGLPFVQVGDGTLAQSKPISEADLASFIADCIRDPEKHNKVLPIGGPGPAMTAHEQGQLLFRVLDKKPWFLSVPVAVMDFSIDACDALYRWFGGATLQDSAEFSRIGKYYATESMLVMEDGQYSDSLTPSYGSDTLEQFYHMVATEGLAGQDWAAKS